MNQLCRRINLLTSLASDTKAAPYWYIRHGMIDRDTSFPVEVTLATAVRGVKAVDFKRTWMTPHSGDHDVQEAYGWMPQVRITKPRAM